MKRQNLRLTDVRYRADPFTTFDELREMGPVVPAKLSLFGNMWLITTYEAVDEALKNDRLFCRNPSNAGRSYFLLFRLMMPGMFRRIAENMLGKDEPDHRRLRVLVDQAFQRQRIADLRPKIESIVDEQLDTVARVAQTKGQVDLVEHLARPVPLSVICELLGLPLEDRPKFSSWFSNFSKVGSVLDIVRVVPGLRKTLRYFREQFEAVRRGPREGLITALVQAEADGDRLSMEELESMSMLLLLAGHETTVHLISNGILALLQLPHVRSELNADWSNIGAAVDEVLRYSSSTQFAKPRWVTEDTVFHGQPLRRGEAIMPVLASANYDPARFDHPHEFQIHRPQNYHLTFGTGPHVCLGMKLAKAETEITLQRLFSRWPELQADFDVQQPDWSKRIGMRSLASLFVRPG